MNKKITKEIQRMMDLNSITLLQEYELCLLEDIIDGIKSNSLREEILRRMDYGEQV